MVESPSPQIPPHQALTDQQVQARMVSVRALRAVLQMPPQSAATFRSCHSLPLHPNDFEAPLLLANGQKKPVPWRPPSASQALVVRRIPEQAAEPARKPVRLKERLREHREMASELLKGHSTRREDRQTADALHPPHEKTAGEDLQAKAMSGLALSADELATLRRENDDEHAAKLASATSSAAWQSPRLTGSPTRTVPSEELARERRAHEATRQQLSWQQHEAQSAAAQAAQAAREAEKQLQLQLIERLGTCEVALASKEEQISKLERVNRDLEAQLERARHELSAQLEAAELGVHTQLNVPELRDTSRQTRRGVTAQLATTQLDTAQLGTAQLGTAQPSRNELEAQLEGYVARLETTTAQLEASQRDGRHVASAQLESGQCHVASAQLKSGQCHVASAQLDGGQGQVATHDLGAQLEAALARISVLAAQLEAARREVEAASRVAEVTKPAPLPPHPARLRRRVVRRAPRDDENEAEAEDDTAATAHASSLKALGIVLGVVLGVGDEMEPSAASTDATSVSSVSSPTGDETEPSTDAMSSPRKAQAEGFGVEVMGPRNATPAAALPPPATVADGSAPPAATLPAQVREMEAQMREMDAQMRQVISTMEEQQARFVAELEESHERERQAWERRSVALERTHKAALAQAHAAHAKESAALRETRRQLDTALESAASLARPSDVSSEAPSCAPSLARPSDVSSEAPSCAPSLARPSDGSSEAPSCAPSLARPSEGSSEAPSCAPSLARQAEARHAPPASPRSRMAPVPLTLAGSIQEGLEKERVAKHPHDAMEDLYDLDLHALYDAHEDEEAEEAAREIERSRKHLVSLLS